MYKAGEIYHAKIVKIPLSGDCRHRLTGAVVPAICPKFSSE